MVETILAGLEVGGQTRVLVAVQVGIHRGAHARVGVGVPDLLQRVEDLNRTDGCQRRALVGRLDDAARDGLLGPRTGLVGNDVDHAHGHAQLERVGQTQPLGIAALVDDVDLLQRRGVGRVGGVLLQHGDGRVEVLEELHVDGLLRVVGVLRLTEVGHGQRSVDVGGALQREDLEHLGHGEGVLGNLPRLVGVAERQPGGHHVGEGHREGDVVVVGGVERIGGRVDAAVVERADGRHVARVGVTHQVAGALVGVGALVAAGDDGIHLHGRNEGLLVDVLSRVGVGVELLEAARAGAQQQAREGNREEPLAQVRYDVSFHCVGCFRIGVLR